MKLATLLLTVLCAAMCFGGSFTCNANNNSDDFTANPRTPVGNR